MSEEVFLETTIQIDRNFTPKQQEIDFQLKGKNLITSTYVLGEYKKSILEAAIMFYNLLEQSESTEEALSRLGTVLYSTRQFDRVMKIFSTIFEDGKMSINDVKKRLSFLIEDIIVARFMRGIKTCIDLTKCQRAKAYPEMIDGMWKLQNISCAQKEKPSCRIEDFLHKNREQLEKISNITSKGLTELTTILSECLASKKLPYGKNCWKIGDAIISCEAPHTCCIFTTNIRDYFPICSLIGKRLFEPVAFTNN